ncbi:6-bladed beta-propeller [uncultured Bacteroides sp.]|jgi:hypothetical protein|uniref:6-bladed beta-propeller n=1 Tax=uncultured Bacteroides sp. TaxID=162156 RepID=UPI0025E7065B|nr:6-bladed beta-propeller [uncultured Bacteroides sp.]
MIDFLTPNRHPPKLHLKFINKEKYRQQYALLLFLYITENLMPMKKNSTIAQRTNRSDTLSKFMRKSATWTFALLSSLMVACESGSNNDCTKWIDRCNIVATRTVAGKDTIVSCDFSAVKQTVQIPISMLVDSLEVIKLDNSNEKALIGFAWPLEITENYIGINVSHSPFRVFTRQGKFVAPIGNTGQGPGEYKLIHSHQIDEAHNRVYLLPTRTKQILVYNLQGHYIGNIPLPYLVHLGQIHVDYDKQLVTIIQLSLTKNFYKGRTPSPPIWIQDMEGNIIHENRAPQLSLSGGGYGNGIRFCENRTDHYIFSLFRMCWGIGVADSLYTYLPDSNKLSPKFTANFGEEIPIHDYRDYGEYFYTYIWGPNNNPKYMHKFTVMIAKRIIVDKHTLKGAFYEIKNDYLGGIALEDQWWTWTKHGYAACMDPGDLIALIEERLKSPEISDADRKFLNNWKDKISPDDNSYVILGKWKKRVH